MLLEGTNYWGLSASSLFIPLPLPIMLTKTKKIHFERTRGGSTPLDHGLFMLTVLWPFTVWERYIVSLQLQISDTGWTVKTLSVRPVTRGVCTACACVYACICVRVCFLWLFPFQIRTGRLMRFSFLSFFHVYGRVLTGWAFFLLYPVSCTPWLRWLILFVTILSSCEAQLHGFVWLVSPSL